MRKEGDEVFFHVGFIAADQLVSDFDAAQNVHYHDARAVAGAVPGDVA